MLKEIIEALKGKDVIKEMIGQIGQMLDAGYWMFDQASDVLMREKDWQAISDPLYDRDKRINELEQNIREQVVTHLAVTEHSDLTACLTLMSVVKDAERIGDYCKNIFEVGRFYQREYSHPEYAGPLDEVRAKLLEMFPKAKKAFVEYDSSMADTIYDEAGPIRSQCDMIVRQLLSKQDLDADEAVAYVLLARFYKRVTAHLGNIATSVVSPIPLLDYRERKITDSK